MRLAVKHIGVETALLGGLLYLDRVASLPGQGA